MSVTKERITVTVDGAVVEVANAAVAAGRAASVSAWVNQALLDLATKERRLLALDEAIAGYEQAHGVITEEALEARRRADRRAARPARPIPAKQRTKRR